DFVFDSVSFNFNVLVAFDDVIVVALFVPFDNTDTVADFDDNVDAHFNVDPNIDSDIDSDPYPIVDGDHDANSNDVDHGNVDSDTHSIVDVERFGDRNVDGDTLSYHFFFS